jgi:hypothetical protein
MGFKKSDLLSNFARQHQVVTSHPRYILAGTAAKRGILIPGNPLIAWSNLNHKPSRMFFLVLRQERMRPVSRPVIGDYDFNIRVILREN